MKKKYEIQYLEIAKNDLDLIFEYILKDNPSSALEILNEIDDTVSKLAVFPKLGKLPRDDKLKAFGYRILVINNYLVFYVITEKFVEIHRVLHSSRDYNNLL